MKKNIQYDGELQVAAGQLTKEGDYWLEKLSGFPLDLEKNSFPADYGEGEKGKGDKETASMPITLPGELVSSLLKLSNKSDSRLFMILTAGLVLTIHKYTGRSDIITGAPIYKQEIDGEFINTVLPLRNRLREDMTFKDLLLDVRRTITEAEENQNYPMSTLLYKLNMPASGDRFPLFDTALLLENIHDKKHIRHTGPAVLFSFFRVDDRIETVLEYHPTLYREETMARLMSHFSHLLLNALSDVSQKTNQLEMLSEAEIKQLLVEFNDTHREYPIDKAIHQLFEEQVEKTPGNTAVAAPDLPAGASAQPDAQEKNPDINAGRRTLTYRELNEESNRLAHYLKDRGVTANSVVGLMQERSTDLVTGMLGIMKAGGAYLPMDPQMPKQRAVTMLEDSSASHLLTHGKVFSDHSFTSLQGLEERSVPIHTTCPRKPLANLDSLPIPDRSLVDYEKYNRYIGQVMVKNIISLQTARGCPYNCFYCSKVWPRKHTFRTAENIFEELQLYYDMGFRRFSIFDDIFNINLKNGEKLFEKIIKSNLDIQLFFPNGLRGDLLNKDYIDLLVEAGLATTAMALETASPRLQKMIDKNLHLEKFRENVEYFCKKYPQVVLELFTIHGFPTETEEEARLTLEFIKEQEWLHFPYVFILKIYPGTEMADLAMEHGVLREDILKCEDLALHEYSPTSPFSESFTKNYQAEFLNDYFLNKERLRHVLPYQARVLTEDEIVQKYDSYLPSGIDSFSDILDLAGIDEADLGIESFLEEENFAVPELNRKLRSAFPAHQPAEDALKLLLVDLSQFFSWDTDMLYDVVEPPLGPIYILTYLQEQLGSEINGKIIKSRIDFDNYEDLKTLLDDFQPDVIGVRTLTFYKDFFHKTISLIRQWGFAGPLIAGGPYATRNTAPLLQDRNIDLAVLSEGEVTFLEIIEKILENSGRLPGREELEKIDGIAFAPRTSQKSYRFARQILMADTLSETLSKQSVANPGFPVEPTLPAYIMYTSGSTGAPKGVVVEHKNVVNVLHWFAEAYDLREEDRIIQLTGFTFDPSVEQIFSALHRGASVYMPHKELISNREDFSRYIEENRITIINFVPATLRTLLADEQQGQFSSLRAVISGGDRLDDALKDSLIAKGYELYNHYGPTETTIDTLRGKCSPGEKVNLGTPIANVQCFVLGGDLRLLPVGVPGELYIAGAGVSRGYLNHPELTAERFIRGGAAHRKFLEVSEPFFKKVLTRRRQELYKTGDITRWLPTGEIEFLGRTDHQVKLRGYRIELGEIENRLSQHESIKEAAAVIKEGEDGSKFICAYYVYEADKDPELMPSAGDYLIWDDLLYYAMAHDKLKNNSYKIAIERIVKGKTVVEVGTGRDLILARLAVDAGAEKVYAIEIMEESYLKAKENLKKFGLEDKIVLIHGDSRDVELPEKVEVNLTNQIGSIGSSEGGIVLHNDARRFLKEKSYVIPHHCVTKIAAVTLPGSLRDEPAFSITSREYTEKIFEKFGYEFDVRLCIQHLPKTGIISDAGIFEDINFQDVIENEASHRINLTIKRETKLDGFILWINFYTVPDHLIDTLAQEHIWKPVYFPAFSPPLEVDKGDRIEADCIRTLGSSEPWPDYKVKGHLEKKDGRKIAFEYNMPYHEKTYKGTPLYKGLFTNEPRRSSGDISTAPGDYELRRFLGEKLPDYMIPAYFVPLKELPLTTTGKIDRRALADPAMVGSERKEEYAAPEGEVESKLVEVWESVLGRQEVGVNENFFMIGGDSIKAIQIVSRLHNEGYKIKVSDVFQNPVITDLAHKVEHKEAGRIPEQAPVTGRAPLLPAHEEFFKKITIHPHHYNQAVMLSSPEGFDEEAVGAVFKKIMEHHDALRMSIHREGGGIFLENHDLDYPLDLKTFDFRSIEDKEKAAAELLSKADEIQASIDLEKGPLLKLGLFRLAGGDRLLIVLHHLITDGISWRILFEDIDTLYRQFSKGESFSLPLKTDSYKYWAGQLPEYAASPGFLVEKEYWAGLESMEIPVIPYDFESADNLIKDTLSGYFRLAEEETRLLLTEVNEAFNTEINDILLCALGLAFSKQAGSGRVLVNLEGHGREEILDHVDINRTVGWFTSIYPVILDVSSGSDLSSSIKKVKESLRRAPNRGIGYGILKYLTPGKHKQDIEFKLEPQVSFNYLGQFDADMEKRSFGAAAEPSGRTMSPEGVREFDIDINGMIANRQLVMSINYSKKQFKNETITQILENFEQELKNIISFCSSKEDKELTPSDLTHNELSLEEIDAIEDQLDI